MGECWGLTKIRRMWGILMDGTMKRVNKGMDSFSLGCLI